LREDVGFGEYYREEERYLSDISDLDE